MKILHINQADIAGGASIAGYRLHQGLLNQGIHSRLLVDQINTHSCHVESIKRKRKPEILLSRISARFGLNYIPIKSTFKIPQHTFYQEADILNFHNIHGDYFNYLALPSLTKPKPAVWTLHDMWSFTGHCAYSFDCDRWQIGCGKCPYPDTYPNIGFDNSHLEWKIKEWVFEHSNLHIVTLSRWLTYQVKQSLLKTFPIRHIPNGIDTQVYQPLDPKMCRLLLNIPSKKKILLCAAQSFSDPRKGGDLLIKGLAHLSDSMKNETVLLAIGNGGEAIAEKTGIQTLNLGFIGGDKLKSVVYSAADLFIFPTRADNLPLVLQESMACGVPMVSFDVGGVSDLVRPGVTGYLAKPEDAQDFCNGIIQLLEDCELREQMSHNCREIACREYALELQAQKYINLYQEILDSNS